MWKLLTFSLPFSIQCFLFFNVRFSSDTCSTPSSTFSCDKLSNILTNGARESEREKNEWINLSSSTMLISVHRKQSAHFCAESNIFLEKCTINFDILINTTGRVSNYFSSIAIPHVFRRRATFFLFHNRSSVLMKDVPQLLVPNLCSLTYQLDSIFRHHENGDYGTNRRHSTKEREISSSGFIMPWYCTYREI